MQSSRMNSNGAHSANSTEGDCDDEGHAGDDAQKPQEVDPAFDSKWLGCWAFEKILTTSASRLNWMVSQR